MFKSYLVACVGSPYPGHAPERCQYRTAVLVQIDFYSHIVLMGTHTVISALREYKQKDCDDTLERERSVHILSTQFFFFFPSTGN